MKIEKHNRSLHVKVLARIQIFSKPCFSKCWYALLRFGFLRYSKPIPHCCLALPAKSTFVYLHFQVLFALENLYLVSLRPHKRVPIRYNNGPPNERLKSSVGTTSHLQTLCDPVVKSAENLYTSFYSSSVAIQIKVFCCFDVLFFPINISIFVNEI